VKDIKERFGIILTDPDPQGLLAVDDVGVNEAAASDTEDTEEDSALKMSMMKAVYGTSESHVLRDNQAKYFEATRSGIAMQTLRQKLNRPLRHGVLATWSFIPVDAKLCGSGRYDQLILCQDYLQLRSASFKCCWCNPCFRNGTANYSMLLRDVTVIEMGSSLVMPFVYMPLLWAIALPILWHRRTSASINDEGFTVALSLLATIVVCYIPGFFFFSPYQGAATKFGAPLIVGVIWACFTFLVDWTLWLCILAVPTIYAFGLLVSSMRGWTRRPYVYFGVLVGARRTVNFGTHNGSSPFWLHMARGQTVTDMAEVVESVRDAAKRSMQADLVYSKRGDSRQGEVMFDPNQVDAVQPMSAAEVVEKHVVSEGAGAGLLMGLEAVPWIIGQLRGLIITAIVLGMTYYQDADKRGRGLEYELARLIGFESIPEALDALAKELEP